MLLSRLNYAKLTPCHTQQITRFYACKIFIKYSIKPI